MNNNWRSVLAVGVVMGLVGCAEWAEADSEEDLKEITVIIDPERDEDGKLIPVEKSDEQWEAELTKKEYGILRHSNTERPFTGRYHDSKDDGVYVCAGCGVVLFDSATKFDSGTGWPSFYQPIVSDHVGEIEDVSLGVRRVENVCGRCGGHLGHVFPDGPKPTGMRYCINGYSLRFVDREAFEAMKGSGEVQSEE